MRSNYSPYPQANQTVLKAHEAEIELAKRQVLQANENLIKVLTEHVPQMLRHHTAQRGLVKLYLDQLKRELVASNSARVTAQDHAWASTMADIEVKRSEFHLAEQAKAEADRVKRKEKLTLTYDSEMQQYYIMRDGNKTMPDGTVKPTQNKVYLPSNHEYLQ